ncbi:MAG: CoA-binding protein, partial [Burkholderiales bacterium]
MTIDLTRLLSPRAIAIVGASTNPSSISGQPLHHMLTMGYTGKLYPVNPRGGTFFGLTAYP